MYNKIKGFLEAYNKFGYAAICEKRNLILNRAKRERFYALKEISLEQHLDFWRAVGNSQPGDRWEVVVRENISKNPNLSFYMIRFD